MIPYCYYRKVWGISPLSLCTTLVLKWGVGAFAPNFMEFVVVKADGVLSAPFAHNLDAKTVELSAKRIV